MHLPNPNPFLSNLHLRIQNIQQTNVRPNQEPDKSKNNDRQVFPQNPVTSAELVGPKRDDFNERRENQCQGAATERSDQGDHSTQIRNGDGKGEGHEHQKGSSRVFGKAYGSLIFKMFFH